MKIGKIDANFGVVLLNDGKGNFSYMPQQESGLRIVGDVRDAALMPYGSQRYLLVGINGGTLINYKLADK